MAQPRIQSIFVPFAHPQYAPGEVLSEEEGEAQVNVTNSEKEEDEEEVEAGEDDQYLTCSRHRTSAGGSI